MLNESIPESGLPKGMYDEFKFRFLSVLLATEFAAYNVSVKLFKKTKDKELLKMIALGKKEILQAGKCKTLTLKNELNILKQAGNKLWFSVQKGVLNWMGDVKVYRLHNSLITQEQIRRFSSKLEPGDVLLARKEWYLSNIGIPGFWTYAELYIGTEEQRNNYFNDTKIKVWL